MMSSTLVETVSINCEDFNDSFLTCGTCLCTYDGTDRTPKLLPCSHTVCRSCLERIVAAQTLGKAFLLALLLSFLMVMLLVALVAFACLPGENRGCSDPR